MVLEKLAYEVRGEIYKEAGMFGATAKVFKNRPFKNNIKTLTNNNSFSLERVANGVKVGVGIGTLGYLGASV